MASGISRLRGVRPAAAGGWCYWVVRLVELVRPRHGRTGRTIAARQPGKARALTARTYPGRPSMTTDGIAVYKESRPRRPNRRDRLRCP